MGISLGGDMDLNTQTDSGLERKIADTGSKKVRTTIYLPVGLHKASKIYCAKNEISLTQFIINYLEKTVHTSNS